VIYISIDDARGAELEARKQRISLAHLLRTDETKASNSADIMMLRRLKATSVEKMRAFATAF
jgi:hypothetical protein